MLFSSHILVEHQGVRMVLRLFDPEGVQLRPFTLGFSLQQGKKLRLVTNQCLSARFVSVSKYAPLAEPLIQTACTFREGLASASTACAEFEEFVYQLKSRE